jgi:hypothetical protein
MSEMIGRVARIMCCPSGCKGFPNCSSIEWREEAALAIAAMREPTGAMKDAGALSYGIGDTAIGQWTIALDGQPTKAWRAMIDEALR